MTTELLNSTPIARKEHVCSWCGEGIPKGEAYHRWTGVFDDDFQSNATHLECIEAYRSLPLCDRIDGYTLYDNERGVRKSDEQEST